MFSFSVQFDVTLDNFESVAPKHRKARVLSVPTVCRRESAKVEL